MERLELIKYPPKNEILKDLVKYIWIFRSKKEFVVDNILFPSSNIDFVLNLSDPITYIMNDKAQTFNGFHFSGIRDSFSIVKHAGMIDVAGVAFHPTGAYPFIKNSLSDYSNKTLELNDVIDGFDSIYDELKNAETDLARVDIIEKKLLDIIDTSLTPKKHLNEFINTLSINRYKVKIDDFCQQIGVNQKTFERDFKKYVGITPKAFIKLTRFHKTLTQMIKNNYENLTSLGYNQGYFDQTHFIKDFKFYMGTTPSKLLKDDSLVKKVFELK